MADLIERSVALSKFIEGDGDDDFTDAYNFAVGEYRRKIAEIPAVNRWIPCYEKLPESVGNKVIVFCIGDEPNTNYVGFGHYDNYPHIEEWYNLETGFPFADLGLVVTHWMPLPEPPKSEGCEE